jgi:endo-1,4-beta-mannosidase
LNAVSGLITAADSQSYDMSSDAAKQQMMDNGLIYFTNRVRNAIVQLDPTALVTVGFFWPQTPNPTRIGDPRVISVYPAIANSSADFADLHLYPIPGDLTLDQLVQNYGFVGYQQQKPVIMGEFGGFTSEYATATDAGTGLRAWQTQSCTYHFEGWLLWTWDTDEQTELWNAMSSGGAINQQLAPASKPDPCAP